MSKASRERRIKNIENDEYYEYNDYNDLEEEYIEFYFGKERRRHRNLLFQNKFKTKCSHVNFEEELEKEE